MSYYRHPRYRRLSRVALALGLLLLAVLSAPGLTAQATPSAVDPARLRALEDQAIAVRGLNRTADVPLRTMDRGALRAYFAASYAQAAEPAEWERGTKLLVILGLLDPGVSLLDLELDLAQQDIAGFYDPRTKTMFVVAQDEAEFSLQEQFTFVHEFGHALQDQHFPGLLGQPDKENGDRALARHAIVEGDAMLLSIFWARQYLGPDALATILAGAPDEDATGRVTAPRFHRTQIEFLYGQGTLFAFNVYSWAGGFAGVNEALRNPPESTEQVLHPDKYFAKERPVDVTLPDLPATLGQGWQQLDTDVLGELDVLMLLDQFGDRPSAERGAAGWGGGRWTLLEQGDRQAVVLKTAWDSEQEAREFFDLYAQSLRTRFGDAVQHAATPTRQALTHPAAATEVRLNGRDVLAVISFDRPSVEHVVAAVGGF